MKTIYYLLLATCLFQSCTAYHRVKSNKLVTKATIKASDFYEEIPFTVVQGLPAFSIRLGQDSSLHRFVFDTGGYTVLSQKLIESASGKQRKSHINVKDGNSKTGRINIYKLDQLNIGSIPFEEVGFAEISFTESDFFSCPGIDGTLGPNIMKECIWYFDNDKLKLIFTDQLERIPGIATAIRIPIKTNNILKPLMKFSIDGQENYLTFDTGDNGFISIQQPLGDQISRDYPSVTKFGQRIRTGHTEIQEAVKLIKIDSIGLGGILSLENVLVSSRNSSSSHNLGIGIFDQFNVVFNLAQEEVYFIKRAAGSLRTELRTFGFGFDFVDQKLIVGYLYNNSPAERAGLAIGDELVEIDGKAFDFPDYCSFLNGFEINNKEEIVLGLKRGNELIQVKLKKEKIL